MFRKKSSGEECSVYITRRGRCVCGGGWFKGGQGCFALIVLDHFFFSGHPVMDPNPHSQHLLMLGFHAPRRFTFLGSEVDDRVVTTSGSLLNAALQLLHGRFALNIWTAEINGKGICACSSFLRRAFFPLWLFFRTRTQNFKKKHDAVPHLFPQSTFHQLLGR